MTRTTQILALVALMVGGCNRPPATLDGDDEASTENDLEWWSDSFSTVFGDTSKSLYVFHLSRDGTLTYSKDTCTWGAYTKTGRWELSGDGSSVELLNNAGTAPFATANSEDDGDSPISFWREADGEECNILFGPVPGGTGDRWERGARCLAVGPDCLDTNLSISAAWCDGVEPTLFACP